MHHSIFKKFPNLICIAFIIKESYTFQNHSMSFFYSIITFRKLNKVPIQMFLKYNLFVMFTLLFLFLSLTQLNYNNLQNEIFIIQMVGKYLIFFTIENIFYFICKNPELSCFCSNSKSI